MIQKIYARGVVKIGRERRHSLMVTIPKKICDALQIEKGIRLYFKLEENRFVVSKDDKFLDGRKEGSSSDTITIETASQVTKEKENDITVNGISLSDLQY